MFLVKHVQLMYKESSCFQIFLFPVPVLEILLDSSVVIFGAISSPKLSLQSPKIEARDENPATIRTNDI